MGPTERKTRPMKRTFTALLTMTAAAVFSASAAASVPALGPPAPPPPSSFGHGVINPYFPLVPGLINTYRGHIDGVSARETVTVTHRVKIVDGIPANVIRDALYLERENGDGMYLAEYTLDWYATSDTGDVWYLGEDTAEYDEAGNLVSTDGSWQAGVDGAVAGIYMPAHPRVGAVYQQEVAADAQDMFRVVGVTERSLTTREWTPLEPGLVTGKVFQRDVGMVLEDTVKGASIEDLRLELVGTTGSGG